MADAWFSGVESVVADDLRFKARLGIGEDVYTSTRVKKSVLEIWDVAGVAATGTQVASSALVAQKFFAVPGLLATLGFGTAAAVTPVGWVIAAGVVSGGAWLGITRYLRDSGDKTVVIPAFINTPLDVLGLGLFDLMAPLALKVAAVDGHIDAQERDTIRQYFVRSWGYSEAFVDQGLAFISDNLDDYDIRTAAVTLAAFARDNPDCKARVMLANITSFLKDVVDADGRIDEREDMAIERIEKVFSEEMGFSLSRTVAPVGQAVARLGGGVSSTARRLWRRKDTGD